MIIQGSKPMQLSGTDWTKIRKGAIIAAAGAGVVFLTDYGSEIDFGIWAPWATAIVAATINFLRKWIADNSTKIPLS